MGRMYSVVFEEVAVTAVQDLFEIVAPADSAVAIHGLVLGQSSDAGDAESEQLNILVHRASTSGSAGGTPTARPLAEGDAAFGGTVETNNTTQGTEGNHLHSECFNVMAGLYLWLPPECRWIVSPSQRLVVELQKAPADSITMSGTLYFEELGG